MVILRDIDDGHQVGIDPNPSPDHGRLMVLAKLDGGVGAAAGPQETVHKFIRKVVNSHPDTLATYTVPTGKTFHIVRWGFQIESGICRVELQGNGTALDTLRSANSAVPRMEQEFGELTPLPPIAAGVLVRVRTISDSDTGKEYVGYFHGFLLDV